MTLTRSALAGLSAAALVASLAAHAQVADLTKATCAQLMDLPRNERGQLIVWLHGYYAGAAQRAAIDRTKLEGAVTAMQEACERNRAMALIGMEARAILLAEPLPSPQGIPSPAPPAGAAPNPVENPNRPAPAISR